MAKACNLPALDLVACARGECPEPEQPTSRETYRQISLPYGVYFVRDGSLVLFNRSYQPLVVRAPDGAVRIPDRMSWIDDVAEARNFYTDWCTRDEPPQLHARLERYLGLFVAGGPVVKTCSRFAEVRRRNWGLDAEPVAEVRSPIPAAVREAVRQRDGDRCVYCGSTDGPFHLDHVLAYSRGGESTEDNLVVACIACNRAKGAKTLDEWKPCG